MSSDAIRDAVRPRRRPRSLAMRINGWYVAMFLASVTLIIAAAAITARDAMDREASLVLERRIARHVAVLELGLPQYRAALESSGALDDHTTSVRVRDRSGNTVLARGDRSQARLVASRTTSTSTLELGESLDPYRAVLDRMRPGAIALAIVALVLAVAGGYYLTRRALAPIRELATVATGIARSGDLSRRVPIRDTNDELDELGRLFNRMLDRNQHLVRGMREALDNVAHDLRTPLTRIRTTAEVALRVDDPADAREALGACIEESDRVLSTLRAIMDISEAETGIMRLQRTNASLRAIAVEAVELYEHVAEQAGITLEVGSTDVFASADPARLRQALANLIDNAIKHTPGGGSVVIEAVREGDEAILRVRDTGEGIPPDAIGRIWDRLYRADPSRTKRGLGLGLSLVKAIAIAHHGRVGVESRIGGGSTFTIALPLAEQDPR
ncbi:MAG: sensor histidine kinase [Kofleriaceae bacterium]